jgi:tuftelin-interacting protein 11
VRNEWNPLDPDQIIDFFDQWTKVFPNAVRAYVVSQMIFPRLRDAVNEWEPKAGSTPIHLWIHPWLPFLNDQLQELYPQIRQKLVLALKSWQPPDALALSLLKPWKPVFDLKSWGKLTSSTVVPKLTEALATMIVDPKKHDTSAVKWVVQWSEYIPSHTICRLLSRQFFPKLHQALYSWLKSSEDDLNFEEVAIWYEDWKSIFPEELEAQEDIRIHFNKCLLMMNAAVSGEDLSQYDPEKDIVEKQPKSQLPEQQRNKAFMKAAANMDASLKDLVENFSVESGIEFLPKVGRFNKSLQVYSFGGISITLDHRNQVVEALIEGKWVTVSLERLLAEHSKRHGPL